MKGEELQTGKNPPHNKKPTKKRGDKNILCIKLKEKVKSCQLTDRKVETQVPVGRSEEEKSPLHHTSGSQRQNKNRPGGAQGNERQNGDFCAN